MNEWIESFRLMARVYTENTSAAWHSTASLSKALHNWYVSNRIVLQLILCTSLTWFLLNDVEGFYGRWSQQRWQRCREAIPCSWQPLKKNQKRNYKLRLNFCACPLYLFLGLYSFDCLLLRPLSIFHDLILIVVFLAIPQKNWFWFKLVSVGTELKLKKENM